MELNLVHDSGTAPLTISLSEKLEQLVTHHA